MLGCRRGHGGWWGVVSLDVLTSVATAIANVFRKFAKIMKILDKIDDVKSRGVI